MVLVGGRGACHQYGMRQLAPSVFLLLAGCADETITGYSDPDTTWRLEEISARKVDAPTLLTFPSRGRIAGQGPCNVFSGSVDALYPWFSVHGIARGNDICPDQKAEADFFDALGRVTLAEVSGPVLVLSDEDGLEMVFRAEGPG